MEHVLCTVKGNNIVRTLANTAGIQYEYRLSTTAYLRYKIFDIVVSAEVYLAAKNGKKTPGQNPKCRLFLKIDQ